MKKAVYILTILLVILNSCFKKDLPASPYLGVYKGTIIDSGFHATGTFVDTLNDYVITVTTVSDKPGYVFLHNGLINTKEGKITGNVFTIGKKLVSKDEFFEVYEWADGAFSGVANLTWTVNFYREIVANNVVIARIRRNGVFVKQ